MRLMKFGGTSVGSPDRIRGALRLVNDAAATGRIVVVVSAFGGVTNALIELSQKALKGSEWRPDLEAVAKRHADAALDLVGPGERASLPPPFMPLRKQYAISARGTRRVRSAPTRPS